MSVAKFGGAFNLFALKLLGFAASVAFMSQANAACDCGSTNSSSPCTGSSITTKINYVTIDWKFNSGGKPAKCGQFANGDYWIAPADGASSVTLQSISSTGSGAVYLDENPVPERMGFLSKNYGNLDTSENIKSSLPKSFSKDTSLVAAVERNESSRGKCGVKAIEGSCVDVYQAVTVLKSVPPKAGSETLRPNLTETTKELLTWDDFDLSRLASKSFFPGEDEDGLDSIREHWTHHTEILSMRDKDGEGYSEGGRAFRAAMVLDDYGASIAQSWHKDMMVILSDDNSLVEKKAALAAMLTYGKDVFYHVYTPDGKRERWFGVGAGQSIGRFPTAVFFAAMAKDPFYGNVLKQASSTQVNLGAESIHELDQINIGPNGPVWGDHDSFTSTTDLGRYWGEMLIGQKFDGASGKFSGRVTGKKTFRDPYLYIDGPGRLPGQHYAVVSSGPIKAFAAEMFMMPEMCEIANYDALIDYAIRITDVGIQTANDPCAPPDPREDPAKCNPYYAKGCKYYGLNYESKPTWGPDPNDRSQCIKNGTDPLTGKKQNGRFASRHGDKQSVGYFTPEVERNWDLIRGNKTSCRIATRLEKPKKFCNPETEACAKD